MTYGEFKTQYHVRLNPQQEAAVRQVQGPVLLLAVPGSGRTTVRAPVHTPWPPQRT